MPIQINCACGKLLRVKEELAGKKVRCPGCNEILSAPLTEHKEVPVFTPPISPPPRTTPPKPVFDDDEIDKQNAVTDKPSVKAPAKSAHDFDDDDDREPRKGRTDDDIDDERGYLRRKRRRRSADRLHVSSGETWRGIAAGVGLMLAGVFLFVVPLMFGFIWYYSVFLFIAGVITVIKAALPK